MCRGLFLCCLSIYWMTPDWKCTLAGRTTPLYLYLPYWASPRGDTHTVYCMVFSELFYSSGMAREVLDRSSIYSADKIIVSDPDSLNRIQIQHFSLITNPDPDEAWFWWPKIHFWSKIAIDLSLGLHKKRPSYRRSLQPSKRTSSTSKHQISWLFPIFVGHFDLLDPDPDPLTWLNPVQFWSATCIKFLFFFFSNRISSIFSKFSLVVQENSKKRQYLFCNAPSY